MCGVNAGASGGAFRVVVEGRSVDELTGGGGGGVAPAVLLRACVPSVSMPLELCDVLSGPLLVSSGDPV